MTQRKPRKLPAFKSEEAERAFWEAHDSTDYFDWSATTSVRLPTLEEPPSRRMQRLTEWLHKLLGRLRRHPDFDDKAGTARHRR